MDSESAHIDYLNTLPQTQEVKDIIEYFNNQIKFKKQTLHFKDKFNVLMSFIKFAKSMCIYSNINIYGSFVRNIIEKIFISTSEIGYGDPVNHDIDMVLYKTKHYYELDKKNFDEFISLLKIIANNSSYYFNFYEFKVVDIIEKTIDKIEDNDGFQKELLMNIPHYVIMLKKDNIKIKLDLIVYKSYDLNFKTWQKEFNINSLNINNNGIFTNENEHEENDSYGFFETIHSIINKTAISNLPFYDMFYSFTHKLRKDKIKLLNQIIWFMAYRMKILNLGYTQIFSDVKFIDYKIEKKEVCILSGNEPPYISIKLKCNHYISVMGLAGLTNIRTSEWSESIKCPMCRTDLDIAFCDNIPPKIKIPSQPEKEIESLDDYEFVDKIISDDNIAYISYILKNQTLNSNNNATWDEAPQRQFDIPRRTMPLVGRRTDEDYLTLQNNVNIARNLTGGEGTFGTNPARNLTGGEGTFGTNPARNLTGGEGTGGMVEVD
jgi:hypothetical protein